MRPPLPTSDSRDDFNFIWSVVGPPKTHSVLLIDSDTMLPLPISLQLLETISGRKAKIVQPGRAIKHVELTDNREA